MSHTIKIALPAMAMLAVLFFTGLLTGCSKPSAPSPASTSALIRTGATAASYYGFKQYEKKNGAEAKQVANAVVGITDKVLIPYLEGNSTAITTLALNEALKAELVKLPAEVKTMISVAAGVLDAYLPAPSADSYLKPEQVQYVRAFFLGLRDGTEAYLAGAKVQNVKSTSTSPGAWLKFE